ncbi:MAG: hypothetical protein QM698_09160 [Micropepsaceae bacterium]
MSEMLLVGVMLIACSVAYAFAPPFLWLAIPCLILAMLAALGDFLLSDYGKR